ncbi:MAG: YihY/virulence factor BrkB family protein [Janthinobacterium lividum]
MTDTTMEKRDSAASNSDAGSGTTGAGTHGRGATTPWKIPLSGWKQVLGRVWTESGKDNIGLVAAGVGFYGFLALVPLLASTILIYGLVADRATVVANFHSMLAVMPADAAKLIGDQMLQMVDTPSSKKGLGLVVALVLALFSARNGAASVITALNIAYQETEKRGIVWLNALALLITAAAVVLAVFAALAIASMAKLEALIPHASGVALVAGKAVSYVVLALVGAVMIGSLYRFGPSRSQAKWVWLTPGSLFASILWILLTLLFGIYVANFGNYNATYGSLGAIVVMLTWLYLSSYVLLFGAELNAELEHQTEHDTTTGRPLALGRRGAYVADHVAEAGPKPLPARGEAVPALSDSPGAADYVAARAGAHLVRVARVGKVGPATTVLATVGLARLRRRGKARQGLVFLGLAGVLAFWRRRD